MVAIGVTADITDPRSLKSALSEIIPRPSFKTLNIVVDSAAPPITRLDRQIEWSDDEWFEAIDVKTVGANERWLPSFKGASSGVVDGR